MRNSWGFLAACRFGALCLTACGGPACTAEGVEYAEGEAVPSPDCNACTCTADGVVCTTMACHDP